jgi:hypothetical protein
MSDQPESLFIPEAPEGAKWLQWCAYHWRINREAFLKPPVVMALVVALCLGFWLGEKRSGEQLDIAGQRTSFLSDELSAYKDRLQGASPDQAGKELFALRAELELTKKKMQIVMPDAPRRLTDQQKDYIQKNRERLAKIAPGIAVFAWSVGDAANYADDFAEQFDKAGIPIFGVTLTACDDSATGVMVGIKDPTHPSDQALEFKKILGETGVSARFTKWLSPPSDSAFDLYVCG